MPAIASARQETFARLVFKGIPPLRAYPQAGYKPDAGNPYRLTDNDRVRSRIAELRRQATMRAKYTVETLTENLELAREQAYRIENPNAQVQALLAIAKLLGLIVDKQEIKANVSSMNSEELEQAARAELGDDVVDLLMAKARTPEPTHDAPKSEN